MLELYLYTGLRRAEGVALVPADFKLDVEHPCVRVERQWTRDGYSRPKGKKTRIVPLRRSLAERVDELLQQRELSPRCKDRHPFSKRSSTRQPLCVYYAATLVVEAGRAAALAKVTPTCSDTPSGRTALAAGSLP